MASPRVFVSSTCYDLGEVRDNLFAFIEDYGFQPILSDRGDVFFHPDLHTHEACINEVENCQLFILIIGGRFGGQYVADKEKSIVNAEYAAAKRLRIPIFTFIKRDVLADHNLFQRNRKIAETIQFPSIDKQVHSRGIFDFIDEVRRSTDNNAYFQFEFCSEIKDALRKQWAGMLFDFLSRRRYEKELEHTNALLANLALIGNKTEEILKKVYQGVDPTGSTAVIDRVEMEAEAAKFLVKVSNYFQVSCFVVIDIQDLATKTPSDWYRFLIEIDDFHIIQGAIEDGTERALDILVNRSSNKAIAIGGELNEIEKKRSVDFQNSYNAFSMLSADQRYKILDPYCIPF